MDLGKKEKEKERIINKINTDFILNFKNIFKKIKIFKELMDKTITEFTIPPFFLRCVYMYVEFSTCRTYKRTL